MDACHLRTQTFLFHPICMDHAFTFDPESGKVDPDRLKQNMATATQIYIDRVNNAPCGSTVIKLFAGSDSSTHQALRSKVLTYRKQKAEAGLITSRSRFFQFYQESLGCMQ